MLSVCSCNFSFSILTPLLVYFSERMLNMFISITHFCIDKKYGFVVLVTMISLIVSMGAPVSWYLSNGEKSPCYLGIITCFGPALVISVVYGCMPPVSASMHCKSRYWKKKSSNIQKGFKVQFLHQEEENKISLNVGIGTGGTMNDAEIWRSLPLQM